MRLGASAASQRDPAESAEVTIAIEEAGLCDGSVVWGCRAGARRELDLLAPHWTGGRQSGSYSRFCLLVIRL
jgi:hypothetical protein